MIALLTRDSELGPRVVPIVADEARTFGMDGLFRQLGIYASEGQLYEPVDSHQVMYYREDRKGQILQEGITEAGAASSWIAAATSYSNHGLPLVPFYLFYSMFGFQRVGDLFWAAGDCRARGFLIGGTAGRTTLAGEGLQHQDGHSHVFASAVPNCVSYDPAFACELAVIVRDGLRRMLDAQDDAYFYVTVANENYVHPPLVAGSEEGILRGMYLFREGEGRGPRVQLLGGGTILREVLAAADLLREDFGVAADVWSVTSFTELAREGVQAERWNVLHPDQARRASYVEQCFAGRPPGPAVAATDWIRAWPEQIRPFLPRRYHTLGTDGFGRSDIRSKLRSFFEVSRHFVVLAALHGLAQEGLVERSRVREARDKYGIDAAKPNPCTV
jgi:pyruvate dehydrogenase E1 component